MRPENTDYAFRTRSVANGSSSGVIKPPDRARPYFVLTHIVAITLVLVLASAVSADDSCQYALDSECDEPAHCAPGTDSTDCADASGESIGESVASQNVETPNKEDTCQYALDGACDEPSLCLSGTDTTDCRNASGAALDLFDSNAYSGGPSFFYELMFMSPHLRTILPFVFAIGAIMLFRARQFPGRVPLMLGMAAIAASYWIVTGQLTTEMEWVYMMGMGMFEILSALLLLIGTVLLARWVGSGSMAGSGATAAADSFESPSMQQVLRSETNAVSEAARAITDLESRLRAVLGSLNLPAEVFASPPHHPIQNVRVVLNELHKEVVGIRAMISITAVPKEYHRFPVEFTVQVQNTLRVRTYHSVLAITDDELTALCKFIAGSTRRLRFRPRRARLVPLQLWRPKNKQTAVLTTRWLTMIGVIVVIVSLQVAPAFGALLILLGAIGWIVHLWTRTPPFALSSGKPVEEPRQLVRLDSWHVVVSDLAAHADSVRSAFIEELRRAQQRLDDPQTFNYGGASDITIREETIWYESTDGRIQRTQTVIRLRRAIVFVHMYGYGRDAFFAWDAHINAGSWQNVPVATGRHLESGKSVTAYAIEPRWVSPNEYDLTDANFLSELVHANLAKVIRAAMRDHQIEQEIDFKIVRVDREGVVGRTAPAAPSRRPSLLKRMA